MTESSKWVGEIPADKLDFLIRRLQQQKAAGGPAAQPPRIAPRERTGDTFPLSFGQQQLWFMEQLEPGTPLYNLPAGLRFTGRLSVPALGLALAEIVRRHEALRTRFRLEDGRPVQQILAADAVPLALPVCDLAGLPADAHETAAEALRTAEARRPFDLEGGLLLRAVLLRLGDEEHRLLLTLHHISSDGWSVGVLLRELGSLYEAFAAG